MAKRAKKPLIGLVVLFALTVAADQASKQWALHALVDETFHARGEEYPVCASGAEEVARERFVRRHRESIEVIDGLFNFKYVENCASAFGLMSRVPESFRYPFFILISLLAAAFIPYLYRKTPAEQRMMLYALPFVLGGAVGNLIDRLVYRYVVDFVDWYVTVGGVERHWPTFNVADAAIVIGIGLMILQMLPGKKDDRAKKPAADKAGRAQ